MINYWQVNQFSSPGKCLIRFLWAKKATIGLYFTYVSVSLYHRSFIFYSLKWLVSNETFRVCYRRCIWLRSSPPPPTPNLEIVEMFSHTLILSIFKWCLGTAWRRVYILSDVLEVCSTPSQYHFWNVDTALSHWGAMEKQCNLSITNWILEVFSRYKVETLSGLSSDFKLWEHTDLIMLPSL